MRAFVLALFFSVVVLRFLLSFRTRELSFFFAFLLSLARTFASSDLAFRLTSWRWKRELRALERSPRVFSSVRRASSRAFVARLLERSSLQSSSPPFLSLFFFLFLLLCQHTKAGKKKNKGPEEGSFFSFSNIVHVCRTAIQRGIQAYLAHLDETEKKTRRSPRVVACYGTTGGPNGAVMCKTNTHKDLLTLDKCGQAEHDETWSMVASKDCVCYQVQPLTAESPCPGLRYIGKCVVDSGNPEEPHKLGQSFSNGLCSACHKQHSIWTKKKGWNKQQVALDALNRYNVEVDVSTLGSAKEERQPTPRSDPTPRSKPPSIYTNSQGFCVFCVRTMPLTSFYSAFRIPSGSLLDENLTEWAEQLYGSFTTTYPTILGDARKVIPHSIFPQACAALHERMTEDSKPVELSAVTYVCTDCARHVLSVIARAIMEVDDIEKKMENNECFIECAATALKEAIVEGRLFTQNAPIPRTIRCAMEGDKRKFMKNYGVPTNGPARMMLMHVRNSAKHSKDRKISDWCLDSAASLARLRYNDTGKLVIPGETADRKRCVVFICPDLFFKGGANGSFLLTTGTSFESSDHANLPTFADLIKDSNEICEAFKKAGQRVDISIVIGSPADLTAMVEDLALSLRALAKPDWIHIVWKRTTGTRTKPVGGTVAVDVLVDFITQRLDPEKRDWGNNVGYAMAAKLLRSIKFESSTKLRGTGTNVKDRHRRTNFTTDFDFDQGELVIDPSQQMESTTPREEGVDDAMKEEEDLKVDTDDDDEEEEEANTFILSWKNDMIPRLNVDSNCPDEFFSKEQLMAVQRRAVFVRKEEDQGLINGQKRRRTNQIGVPV